MSDIHKEIEAIKKKISYNDSKELIVKIEKFSSILDNKIVMAAIENNEHIFDEIKSLVSRIDSNLNETKSKSSSIKKDIYNNILALVNASLSEIYNQVGDHLRILERVTEYTSRNTGKMRFFGLVYSSFFSLGLITTSVYFAAAGSLFFIPFLLTGSLLAGVTCSIATGQNINLKEYSNALKIVQNGKNDFPGVRI